MFSRFASRWDVIDAVLTLASALKPYKQARAQSQWWCFQAARRAARKGDPSCHSL